MVYTMPSLIILSRRTLVAALAALPATGFAHAARPPASRPALPLVMLDPGHGGKDPGAVGVSGTYEKHVAFATAQELRRQLDAGGHCRVALTRSGDVFVPLPDRVGLAQRAGAALFVSLHADAVTDPGVRGASVYTMSDAASDPQTAALARRENGADRYGANFHGLPPDVAQILSSLVLKETRRDSAVMARHVVGALQLKVGLLANPARHAAFAVLKASDIPSILVEMGFMSNRADEDALTRPQHRSQVAAAMRIAIEATLAAPNRAIRGAVG